MHVASRSYLTAGVALVTASTIAVSPIAPPTPDIKLPAIPASSAAVTLSALTNPLQLWAQVIETSLTNADTLGQKWLADPAPIVRQVIANQLHTIANLPAIAQALAARLGEMNPADPTSVPATIQQFITDQLNGVGTLTDTVKTVLDQLNAMMNPADPYGVPATVKQMLDQIAQGEYATAFTTFAGIGVAVGFPVIMAGFPIAGVFSQSFRDLANIIDPTGVASQPLRNFANFIDLVPSVLPGVLINGLLGPLNSAGVATAATLEDLTGAVKSADPAAFVAALVNAPAKVTNAFLNGYMAPGGFPMAGLIGGPFGISSIGTVLDTLKAFATAIASPGAAVQTIRPRLAASTVESASVVTSPLSSTPKTTVTVDIAPNVDAKATTETASSAAADTSAKEASATDAKPTADKEAAAESGHFTVSLKAEPGKTGMGTTKPDEAKSISDGGDDLAGTVKGVTDGLTKATGGAASTAGAESGSGASTSSTSSSASSSTAGKSGSDGA